MRHKAKGKAISTSTRIARVQASDQRVPRFSERATSESRLHITSTLSIYMCVYIYTYNVN